MEKLLLTRQEVSDILGISLRTVDSILSARQLPSRRIGRRVFVERRVLEKFVTRDHSIIPQGTKNS
jgi:excisionase family DNA binding protein